MLLLGSVELRNVNPQVFLSTVDILRAALTCTLLWANVNPVLTSVYYYPPHILLDAPLQNITYNCTDLNMTLPVYGAGDARVAAWYTFENSTEIMAMNLVQFNTMITYSSFVQDYKRIVNASSLIAAGPYQLLHLPGPVAMPVLPTNSADAFKLSLLVVLTHMVAVLYIVVAAAAET